MAWDNLKPAADGLIINFPAESRANFNAIELGQNTSLLITNVKIDAAAAIVDTKLATIATAGKVNGTAITLLANTPGGAGTIPLATIPDTLTGKDADLLDGEEGAYYRDADQVDSKHAADLYNYGIMNCFDTISAFTPGQDWTDYNYLQQKIYINGSETSLVIYAWLGNTGIDGGENKVTCYFRLKIGNVSSGTITVPSQEPGPMVYNEYDTTIDVSAISGYQTVKCEYKTLGVVFGSMRLHSLSLIRPV